MAGIGGPATCAPLDLRPFPTEFNDLINPRHFALRRPHPLLAPDLFRTHATPLFDDSSEMLSVAPTAAPSQSLYQPNGQDGQSISAPSQHRRGYQACDPCRKRKVKCDLGSRFLKYLYIVVRRRAH